MMKSKKKTEEEKVVILLNLRSVQNTASVFRTAEGAGISKVYLVGTTPSPEDRFGNSRGDFAKVALGAETTLSWEYRSAILPVLKKLREEKFQIVAVEQDKVAINYKKFSPSEKTAFIFGEETKGIPRSILEKADSVVEIPMQGSKESLNVSVAAGIILFGCV